MKNEWFVIEVVVKGELVELVSAILAESGSQGTVIDERELDTFIVPDDDLDARASYRLKAYFSRALDPALLIEELSQTLAAIPMPGTRDLVFELGDPVQMEDWAENWKQNFSAMQIGAKLIIRPSWEEQNAPDGVAVVEIDPGMAFGTGTHGTTRLCLEIIEQLLSGTSPPQNMLDVGTGSGILALGAAALGCPDVLANDIDADVCKVAVENVCKNSLEQKIRVTDQPLEQLTGQYDLVVANILAEENVRLRDEFMRCLAPDGVLVLSGILREKESLVRDGFALKSLDHLSTRYADEWVCLVFRRN